VNKPREDSTPDVSNRLPSATPGAAQITLATASLPPTTHMTALDLVASGLHAASPQTATLSWAQIAQCTLSAARDTATAPSSERAILGRRALLNDTLFRAFMTRKHGAPWSTFDRPTLHLALADLVAAEQARPTPEL
jgi:hypothetical protein